MYESNHCKRMSSSVETGIPDRIGSFIGLCADGRSYFCRCRGTASAGHGSDRWSDCIYRFDPDCHSGILSSGKCDSPSVGSEKTSRTVGTQGGYDVYVAPCSRICFCSHSAESNYPRWGRRDSLAEPSPSEDGQCGDWTQPGSTWWSVGWRKYLVQLFLGTIERRIQER